MIRRHPIAALAVSSICFALMAIATRELSLRGYTTAELVVWRMGIGAIGCYPILRASGETLWVDRKALMLWRSLVGAASIVTYFWSISLLPVGLATLFNYLGPLFTTLFAARFLGERPGGRLLLGMLVAFAGAMFTVRSAVGSSALGFGIGYFGVAVGVCSAVCQGAAVTLIRKLRRTEGATTIFFWFSVVTTVCCLPFALASLHLPPGHDLPLLFGMAAASLAAQLLFTAALGHVPAATYSILSPLTPATAFVVGAWLLAEPITARVAAGALLAVLGVAVGTLGWPCQRRPPKGAVAPA